jgi:alkanesulfonate monooxygenase SsuD/methylene tetrahydromethanopterin reductase-like flavin-dependent oxidoreductase (luciferase family)
MWSPARVAQSKVWIARGRAKAPDRGPLDIALGIPTFVGDDLEAMRNAARANLALFTTFPFYQRMFRASGFPDEAAKAEQGAGGASYSDRMLDAICLIGPISRCRDQLAAFRAAGVDLPILSPSVGVEGASEVIKAFRQ